MPPYIFIKQLIYFKGHYCLRRYEYARKNMGDRRQPRLNFIPFFIGKGKKHCFINDKCLSITISKVSNIIEKVKKEDSIALFLREPDTRFYLGKGWKQ